MKNMMKRLLILNICLYAQARNLIEMPVPDVDSRQMERAMEDVGGAKQLPTLPVHPVIVDEVEMIADEVEEDWEDVDDLSDSSLQVDKQTARNELARALNEMSTSDTRALWHKKFRAKGSRIKRIKQIDESVLEKVLAAAVVEKSDAIDLTAVEQAIDQVPGDKHSATALTAQATDQVQPIAHTALPTFTSAQLIETGLTIARYIELGARIYGTANSYVNLAQDIYSVARTGVNLAQVGMDFATKGLSVGNNYLDLATSVYNGIYTANGVATVGAHLAFMASGNPFLYPLARYALRTCLDSGCHKTSSWIAQRLVSSAWEYGSQAIVNQMHESISNLSALTGAQVFNAAKNFAYTQASAFISGFGQAAANPLQLSTLPAV